MTHRISNETIDRLRPAVGTIILHWGFIETALEALVAVVYNYAGGKHHLDAKKPGLPKVWEKKREFLRRCFTKIEDLSSLNDEAHSLLDRVARLEPIRHSLIHGYLSDYQPPEDCYLFRGLRVDSGAEKLREVEHRVTLEQMNKAADDTRELAGELADFVMDRMDRFAEPVAPTSATRT